MRTKLDKYNAAITKIEEEARVKVAVLMRPVIVKEYRKAHKKGFKIPRIIFGNGTCLFTGPPGQEYLLDGYSGERIPKGLHYLAALCDLIAYDYPVEDITEADL